MRRRWIGTGAALLAVTLAAAGTVLAEDPKAAAQAIGQAGLQAAGAVARGATSADAVPGYAGTDLPERQLTAGGMPDAANVRLADPDDLGGMAGRAVIDGATLRPDADVPSSDPAVVRSEGVVATPQSAAHRADGLASGTVQDCGAGLQDAQSGGACGSVRFCVGGGCETVPPQANDGFVDAAARLNMVVELGGEEFDRGSLRFFDGQRRACRIQWGGLADCCRNSGLLVGLGNCSHAERELAQERHDGHTHYLGEFCARRILGICVRRERAWCVFGSKLGRIFQQQGRAQIGVGWGSCRGLTVSELEGIDFDALDLREFTADLLDGGREPSVSLPDAGGTQTLMRDRVRAFYGRGG
ncbi:MAG: conjugal transfer protein TraN [Rhodospirillales bacterium]|nr:conjugal transfer protein TraN [Rhodospirillales bacterium]